MAGRAILVRMPRLGLMCGTFDPPHIGHLLLAHTAVEQLGLTQVLFLPVGQPTHKTSQTTAVHRLAMTRAAIADNPRFILDPIDIERPAPHYTATLLPLLTQKYPDHELWLLLGEDSLHDLPNWYQPQKVMAQAQVAVLPRPSLNGNGNVREDSPLAAAVTWLDGPVIHLSSTQLRGRLRVGLSGRYVLPTAVQDYIRAHQLYKAQTDALA